MVMTRLLALLIAVLAFGLAACGGDDEDGAAEPSGTPLETIQISETDFKLEPATVDVDEAGLYTFRVVNDGQATHALEIEGSGIEEETDDLGPGESAELTVELEAGEYELYCPVGDHKDRGMTGSLKVGGGGSGAGTEEEETSSGYGY